MDFPDKHQNIYFKYDLNNHQNIQIASRKSVSLYQFVVIIAKKGTFMPIFKSINMYLERIQWYNLLFLQVGNEMIFVKGQCRMKLP